MAARPCSSADKLLTSSGASEIRLGEIRGQCANRDNCARHLSQVLRLKGVTEAMEREPAGEDFL